MVTVENHMVIDLDQYINDQIIGETCHQCRDPILIEHVWNGTIVCSHCYYFLKEEEDLKLTNNI